VLDIPLGTVMSRLHRARRAARAAVERERGLVAAAGIGLAAASPLERP
jgi:hypothetical protein